MPEKLKRICDATEKTVTLVSAFLLLGLVVLVCTQVFARYVLNASVTWISEISVKVQMWVGLLGAAGCVWTDAHMRLNLVLDRLHASVRVWVHVFIDILIGAFSIFILVNGIEQVVVTMGETLPTVPIAEGFFYLVLPIAACLMAIFSAMNLMRRLWEHFTKKEADEHG